jgi:hypothetical protein
MRLPLVAVHCFRVTKELQCYNLYPQIMRSLHSPIRRRRFMVKFFRAKSLKTSAIDSVTKRIIQAKLKHDNNNSVHNYTKVIKINTYIVLTKSVIT